MKLNSKTFVFRVNLQSMHAAERCYGCYVQILATNFMVRLLLAICLWLYTF